MSSPSLASPPDRPVPPAPAPAPEPPPAPPTASTPPSSVDDEVDLSTLRFLRTSLRTPYLPYLVRISLFTLAAKLVRVLAPPLLRFIARLSSWAWTALTAVVRFAAWSGMWLGLAALALWLLVGAGGALVYVALSLKPRVRAWARASPGQARLAQKAVTYGGAWVVARRALGAWAGKVVVALYAAWEAWAFFGGGRRVVPPVAVAVEQVGVGSSASRSPEVKSSEREHGGGAGVAADGAGQEGAAEEGVDDEELERWARQAKESLLRDSLLRQGRKAGGGAARAGSEEGHEEHGEGAGAHPEVADDDDERGRSGPGGAR
ncbi:hypothetical protein JCM3775_004755 [Rhodotorula graminis]|uniref:Uncharacterized protein n=1 Tax=Rhodotorula graminis (strain WP1) TaxID=578459 RepID=A0A0P9EFF3_RHOGW|nr:uncharacterized protein RHOBADRAFT_56225 [Rhodotorula graminis WP1]KPV72102.1 hypothetical protein RHOBADRAFT_56225 [Rhodotorula graminis WP1]